MGAKRVRRFLLSVAALRAAQARRVTGAQQRRLVSSLLATAEVRRPVLTLFDRLFKTLPPVSEDDIVRALTRTAACELVLLVVLMPSTAQNCRLSIRITCGVPTRPTISSQDVGHRAVQGYIEPYGRTGSAVATIRGSLREPPSGSSSGLPTVSGRTTGRGWHHCTLFATSADRVLRLRGRLLRCYGGSFLPFWLRRACGWAR